jgi:hypothetical protein
MLAFMHWRLPEVVRAAISHWKDSTQRTVQQAYGEMVGLIAMSQPTLPWSK